MFDLGKCRDSWNELKEVNVFHIRHATEFMVQSSFFNMSQSKVLPVNFTEFAIIKLPYSLALLVCGKKMGLTNDW